MCGICGILLFDHNHQIDSSLLELMVDTMAHRGPDGNGIYTNNSCGLGHRRLSIIDIATGQQPMSQVNNRNKITIVFNGEIYNYLNIRARLQALGYTFKTDSDTEVILLAYNEWAEDCVLELRGMFAFAIWDENKRALFIARDRIGEKPLYYYQDESCFVFGSEIKAILASKKVDAEIEPFALDSFMTLGYVPGSLTMFKHIYKLEPGHKMIITDAPGDSHSYWSINYESSSTPNLYEAIDQLDSILKESVKMRLMSEVSLGVFLSGGLDSSAITALMHNISSQKIKTFSVGYKNSEDSNELNYAKIVADKFETDHHEFILEPDDFFDSIPDLVNFTEEPLVETAAIPLFRLSQEAKKYATVLLSGEGSDEIFAGYGLYNKMLKIHRCSHIGKILSLFPNHPVIPEKLCKYLDWLAEGVPAGYRGISCDLTDRVRNRLYSEDYRKQFSGNEYSRDTFHKFVNHTYQSDPLAQLLAIDLKTWLVDDLLLKADKMTMATSVELRVPFLDHEVVEFAATLPSSFKLKRNEGKYILKKLMERYLPSEIIYRKKLGFAVPTQKWFGGDLLEKSKDVLLDPTFLKHNFFKREYIENILTGHSVGKEDYSRRIFSLLVLANWLRIFKI